MEPSEAKNKKRFSILSEKEMQNLNEGKNSENTRKGIKNAVVIFLACRNEVKPEDEGVKIQKGSQGFKIVFSSFILYTYTERI